MVYNLTAEYAALIITFIIIMSFVWNKELHSTRHRMFKLLYHATFLSIIVTIATTVTSQYFTQYPLWLVEALKVLYYITSPIATLFCFFYAVALTHTKGSTKNIDKKWIGLLIPYIAYALFVASNYIFHHIFYISPEEGYVRGRFFQCTYIIAAIYIFGIICITLNNRKTTHKSITLIICLNMLVSILITGFQFFNSHILLSGFASISGTLIIYIYVQNSKSITDTLTGLLNRQPLIFNLHKLAQNKTKFSLYVFCIRNFKGINDQYGIEVGDAALGTIAKSLLERFDYNSLYRYSGDEFALVSTKANDTFHASVKAFVKQFENNVLVDDKSITFTVLYTRVDFPEFSTDIKTLISTVDYSISTLKKNTYESNFLYDITICDEMKRINHILEKLKDAIENDGFEVCFQPIYSTKSNTFPQAEAIVKFKDEQYASITAKEFIPIAEKNGLIIQLTYIVFEHTCRALRSYLDIFGDSLHLQKVLVKFPYAIFFQNDMARKIFAIMKKYIIKPENIIIEITEQSFHSGDSAVKKIIAQMEKAKFSFVLGNFGIENSNPNTFLTLPIQYIRIDRSLLASAVAQRHYRAFFKNLVQGIQSIGKSVIVEGVEEKEHREYIVQCGCEFIQGAVYFNPLEFDSFKKFLAVQQRTVNQENGNSFDKLNSFLTENKS